MPQAANRERGGVRSRGDQTSTRRVRAGDIARTVAKKVRLGLACSHRSAEQRLEKTVRSPQIEGRRKTPPAAPSSSWAGLRAGTTWFRLGKFAWTAGQRRPRHEVASDGPVGPRRRKVSRESPAAVCIRQHGTAAAPDPSPRLRFVVISERGQRNQERAVPRRLGSVRARRGVFAIFIAQHPRRRRAPTPASGGRPTAVGVGTCATLMGPRECWL